LILGEETLPQSEHEPHMAKCECRPELAANPYLILGHPRGHLSIAVQRTRWSAESRSKAAIG
jgi:hypothetical protein